MTPSTTLHPLSVGPVACVCIHTCVCVCVSAHCFYATLSEAPSGLDNTSPLLLSVSHSSLFPSPWRGREGVKKKRGGGWGGSGNNRLLSQEGL